jgi:hypothetical protein
MLMKMAHKNDYKMYRRLAKTLFLSVTKNKEQVVKMVGQRSTGVFYRVERIKNVAVSRVSTHLQVVPRPR